MEQSDAELIAEYLSGNEAVLELLVKRHLGAVYNFSRRILGSAEDADDVTQEVFLKAWKNLKKFQPEKNFRTWILSIARNSAVDFLRKRRGIPFSNFETEDGGNFLEETLSDDEPLPPELLAKAEDIELLERMLSELSPDYRAVLSLRYQERRTFEEIGEILGKPTHTVKSHHRRALIKLRAYLPNA